MKEKITVVWGIDKKYLLQAFVVMHSVLKNSKEEYSFYILSADEIKNEIDSFSRILEKKYNNFTVKYIHIDARVFDAAEIYSEHLSKAAYNRLLIAQLLPQYDKCIYLDCDVLVQGDLKELYDIDVKDYYIAGVKDNHVIADNEYERKHEQVMGIPDRNTYVNSGVMVMNLKKIREDDLTPRFLELCKRENWNEDQDVLNICCYGKIKLLPLKYNIFHFYNGNRVKLLFDLPYEKTDFDFDWYKPLVLHMGGRWKPWVSERYAGAQSWWEYAGLYQETEEYQYYKAYCSKDKKNIGGVSVIADWCKTVECTVIWGFTDNGRRVCDILQKKGVRNIRFVDNNADNYTLNYNGIPVTDMQSIRDKYANVAWVISCGNAYEEVLQQLETAGVANEEIIWWHGYAKNSAFYYRALSEDYYEKELEDIALLENVSIEELKENLKKQQQNEKYKRIIKRYYLDQWLFLSDE